MSEPSPPSQPSSSSQPPSGRERRPCVSALPPGWAQAALWQSPVGVAILAGPEHVFVYANQHYTYMVAREQVLGKTVLQVFPELRDAPALTMLRDVYETGRPQHISQLRVALKRGRLLEDRCFNCQLSRLGDGDAPLNEHGGDHVLVVAVDVTDQVRGREVLEKAHLERSHLLAELKHLSQAKNEFLAMLGHELRNPLAPIVSAVELMRRHAPDVHDAERSIIDRQVSALVRLIDDLLGVSALEQAQIRLKPEPVDMAEVVREAVRLLSLDMDRRNQHLELDIGPALMCSGDRSRLVQALAQVVGNAVRYSASGGHIKLRAQREHDSVIVSVKDNGRGIAPDVLPRVFELFFQGHQSIDRPEGGLGVGLTVARNLIELHGGTIVARSAGVGKGSEFVICVPVLSLPRPQELEFPAATEPTPPHQALRILVVDDNEDAAQSLGALLSAEGHTVEVATMPEQAIDIASRLIPQVAVLDIGLPGMDGHELGIRIRQTLGSHGCRLIALTGYGQQRDLQRSLDKGFSDHLVKPVSFEELVAALNPR